MCGGGGGGNSAEEDRLKKEREDAEKAAEALRAQLRQEQATFEAERFRAAKSQGEATAEGTGSVLFKEAQYKGKNIKQYTEADVNKQYYEIALQTETMKELDRLQSNLKNASGGHWESRELGRATRTQTRSATKGRDAQYSTSYKNKGAWTNAGQKNPGTGRQRRGGKGDDDSMTAATRQVRYIDHKKDAESRLKNFSAASLAEMQAINGTGPLESAANTAVQNRIFGLTARLARGVTTSQSGEYLKVRKQAGIEGRRLRQEQYDRIIAQGDAASRKLGEVDKAAQSSSRKLGVPVNSKGTLLANDQKTLAAPTEQQTLLAKRNEQITKPGVPVGPRKTSPFATGA